MEIVTDMGAHARFIWPAYGAFVILLGGLVVWAWTTSARAKAELKRREAERR